MEKKLTLEDSYKNSHYQDLEDFIMIEVLGFCGCGAPQLVLDYLLDILRSYKRWSDDIRKENCSGEDAYNYRKSLFKSEGEEWFIYYLLGSKELTEHGGSVPGWLTEKGEQLLLLLEKWKEENA